LSDPAPARSEPNEQDEIVARVVAALCVEWFARRDASYGWRDFAGDAGEAVGLEHFGESADHQTLYKEFGITAGHVGTAAKASLARVRAR
jgi:transketolase